MPGAQPLGDRDAIALETPVTTVIQQRPKPDAVARYEDWLKEIIPVAQQFAGHRGVNVIRPQGGSDAYTMVHKAPERVKHGARIGPNPAKAK